MKWRWYHGVMWVIGIEIAATILANAAKKTRKSGPSQAPSREFKNPGEEFEAIYTALKQPVFAPPGWVFFPIWQINNALATWGLLRVLNAPKNTSGRREFLGAHGVFWLTYTAFSAAYFSQRSPIKGAILTDIGLGAALLAEAIALRKLEDKKVAWSLATLVPWLLLAASVSTCAALWNRDEWFGIGPFVEAPQGWVKAGTGTGET